MANFHLIRQPSSTSMLVFTPKNELINFAFRKIHTYGFAHKNYKPRSYTLGNRRKLFLIIKSDIF